MNKHIWVIVGFGFDYIQGQIENRELEEQYRHTVVKSRFVLPPEVREKRLKNLISKPSNRGYFLSKELSIQTIENNCQFIQEQGYYTYLLIEKHGANTIDAHCWHEPDGETWFKLSDGFTRYEPCEKPDCLVGVVSFA
jgi:hypothetical protein